MAQLVVQVQVTKRWFFIPALTVMVMLGRVELLHDQHKAAKWLADHAMRVEVA